MNLFERLKKNYCKHAGPEHVVFKREDPDGKAVNEVWKYTTMICSKCGEKIQSAIKKP